MQVRAKERGFHGCLRNPGDEFAMPVKEGESLPGWVELAGEGDEGGELKKYHAARSAAGKFVVKDATGHPVEGFLGTKAEAEAEAERLNAESEQA